MVQLATVREKNAAFAAQKHEKQVAVFIGATSGIGEATLDTITTLLVEPTLYVVGRSTSRFATQRERLQKLNPDAKIIFIEAEITQLAEVDRVSKQISSEQSRIDYLCMSAGYLPVAGPQPTKEGLEQCFVLSYLARIRFLHNFLPLLHQSSRPRVLSVLNGGGEAAFQEDDLGLKTKWTMFNLVYHTTTFMTLTLSHLAKQNQGIAFLHSGPGQVRTEITRKPKLGDSAGIFAKLGFLAMRTFMFFFQAAKGTTPEESGQRHAYVLTGDTFGPGAWRVLNTCEEAPPSELVDKYKKDGWEQKIWDFTVGVWDETLGGKP